MNHEQQKEQAFQEKKVFKLETAGIIDMRKQIIHREENPILPMCATCVKECKVHEATGLISFKCHDWKGKEEK